MSLVNYLYSGLRRTPASSIVNTVTALAGVVGIIIAVSTANQPALEVRDYAGRLVFQVTGSGAIHASGALKLPNYNCSSNGNAGKLTTDSNGNVTCADDISSGTNSGNVLALTNARFVKKQGDTMTGGLLIESGTLHGTLPTIDAGLLLEIAGTASGRILHAQDSLQSSGSLVVSGSMSGGRLYTGAGRFSGSLVVLGAMNLESATSCTALQTDTKGAVSCNNTVYLTTQTVQLVGQGLSNPSGLLTLNQTITGAILRESTSIADSGTLIVNGISKFRSALSGSSIHVESALTSSGILIVNGATKIRGVASGSTIHAEKALTSSGLLIISGQSFHRGTTSGSIIHAEKNLSTSGTIVSVGDIRTKGILSGANIVVNGTTTIRNVLYTWPTANGANGTVLTNDSAGVLTWSNVSASGLTQAAGDLRYVNQQGDTMSGGLLIVNGGNGTLPTIDVGLLLEIAGTASGRILHAQDMLNSSGTLIVQGNAFVRGTTSGSVISAQRSLNSSGSLSVKGAATIRGTLSGTTMVAMGKIGIRNVAPTNALQVGSTLGSSTPSVLSSIFVSDIPTNTPGAAQYIGNWNSSNQWGLGPLNVANTIRFAPVTSTSNTWIAGQSINVWVNGTLSGSIVMAGPGTAALPSFAFEGDTNTGLYWQSADTLGLSTAGLLRLTVDATGNVGIGTTNTTSAKLDVVGTISGSLLSVTSSGTSTVTGRLTASGVTTLRKGRICRTVEWGVGGGDPITAAAIGTGGVTPLYINQDLDRMTLSGAWINAYVAGTTKLSLIQVKNATQGNYIFTGSGIGLGSGRKSSGAYIQTATPYIVSNGDFLVPWAAAVATTPPKGLQLTLRFCP